MEPELFAALDGRLQRIERETATLRADLDHLAGAARPAAPAVPVFTSAFAPQAAAEQAAPGGAAQAPGPEGPAYVPPAQTSLETALAGRGLQIAGVLLVLLATAFFLNLAFTRGWIGPAERIVLGLIAGLALIGEGARRARPRDLPIAEGLIALGAGILYLALWAAVAVYPQLHVSRLAAFAAMIAVTTILAVLAARRRSERIALFGLIGGFITPLLLNSNTPEQASLAAYLLVLSTAFAALSVRARFRVAEAATFVAAALYLPAFVPAGPAWPIASATTVASLLCGVFAVAFALGSIRDRAASTLRLTLLAADGFAYAAMLAAIFHGHDTSLGASYLILAAVLLLAARYVPVPAAMQTAYGYLGLGAATLALPALLHRNTLLDALLIEGAALVVIGARRADRVVASAGALIGGFSLLWLLGDAMGAPPANTPLSTIALSFAIAIACLAYARTQLVHLRFDDAAAIGWANVTGVALNVVALAGITRVLLDALGGPTWNTAVPSHAQFAISIAWTAYAALLFGTGMRRALPLLRWQGLALFALTIGKVFTIDLGNVDVAWRIGSFVVLGVVCLGASAWYMRSQAVTREAQA